MYFRIIKNDIKKSKLVTFVATLFICISSMLMALAGIMFINLTGSRDILMEQAKTPHYLQMHSGKIDEIALESFSQNQENIDNYQVASILNVEGAKISSNGSTLANSVEDNTFTIQNRLFDYLLDLDGNVINPKDGEVYVPIVYYKKGFTKVGNQLKVDEKTFTVAGFLRDSQMNSTLASSKRFLISNADFLSLKKSGNIEYLIEFRFHDKDKLSDFENAYLSAKLPTNGPTITYPMFRIINVFSDGITISIILLISITISLISLLCIRFTVLAKIEDEYLEIGTMKAIGIRLSSIKKIYLVKYLFISGVGSLLGFVFSLLFRENLLKNIRLYMGDNGKDSISLVFGFITTFLLFISIILYVNFVLRRFRKISASSALRFGNIQEKNSYFKYFNLAGRINPNTNIFLGIKDILARKKQYITILVITILSLFILVVPYNLYNTISNDDFINYTGVGLSDLRIDIQQTKDISQKVTELEKSLKEDKNILSYNIITTESFTTKNIDGSERIINVDLGDHSIYPINYSSGSRPKRNDEIALSSLNAEYLNKNIGDTITLIRSTGSFNLIVSGIYTDITNGGKTAKALLENENAEIMRSYININLKSRDNEKLFISEYTKKFSFSKISSVSQYIKQSFGGTIKAIKTVSMIAVFVSTSTIFLIIILFMKMLLAKDSHSISVMKTFGFSNSDIRKQYLIRILFVLSIGITLGILLANTFGAALIGVFISNLGVASFNFNINPLITYILFPFGIVLITVLSTWIGTSNAGNIDIRKNLKE